MTMAQKYRYPGDGRQPPQNGKANLTGQRLGYGALPKKSCEIWVYSPQKCINIWMSTNNYQLFLVFDTVSTQIYPFLQNPTAGTYPITASD